MDEKKQFANRLRAAMIAAGYEPRPNVLEAHFNSRYWGRSVTYQAVRRWLIGMSIPEQEKLQVLADWLGVEAHVLRYGQPSGRRRVGEPKAAWPTSTHLVDRKAIDAFLTLAPERRRLVRELIAMLARQATRSRGGRKDEGAEPDPSA